MNAFDTSISNQRVRVGRGIRHELCDELINMGCARALILSTPGQAQLALDVASTLGGLAAGVCSSATMHTPVEVTEDVLSYARLIEADCFVAIGGGSTIGLSKALALRTKCPQLVLPTTYSGSEATPILGQTKEGRKETLTDPKVLPEVVLYDPELAVSLPELVSITSGLNAMAHAVEGLYAKDKTPQTTQLAWQGLEAFSKALPLVVSNPNDLEARETTLKASWACGAILGSVGMALHHKLCHTLGGSFGLPHAETHSIVLPHSVTFNEIVVAEQLAPVRYALGGDHAGQAIWKFARHLGAPMTLKGLGLREADLDHAAEIAVQNPYWNPREVTREGIRALLQNAWAGNAPTI
ncbi:maleylacetate reductase [Ruegeria arenilitoris]|uniref:maleylacetate reductase n=1 Tax=Ruegeria arenilitoris TaxID=1173585 RepID=UPI00147EC69E|nr:maleylacetate reductase [Ruegeria arenilitoris]